MSAATSFQRFLDPPMGCHQKCSMNCWTELGRRFKRTMRFASSHSTIDSSISVVRMRVVTVKSNYTLCFMCILFVLWYWIKNLPFCRFGYWRRIFSTLLTESVLLSVLSVSTTRDSRLPLPRPLPPPLDLDAFGLGAIVYVIESKMRHANWQHVHRSYLYCYCWRLRTR